MIHKHSKLGGSANKGNPQVLNPGTHTPTLLDLTPTPSQALPQGILMKEPPHPIQPKNSISQRSTTHLVLSY